MVVTIWLDSSCLFASSMQLLMVLYSLTSALALGLNGLNAILIGAEAINTYYRHQIFTASMVKIFLICIRYVTEILQPPLSILFAVLPIIALQCKYDRAQRFTKQEFPGRSLALKAPWFKHHLHHM